MAINMQYAGHAQSVGGMALGQKYVSTGPVEKKSQVLSEVDRLDAIVCRISEASRKLQERLSDVLQGGGAVGETNCPKAVLVPLADRIGNIAANAEDTEILLRSIIDRLEL